MKKILLTLTVLTGLATFYGKTKIWYEGNCRL